MIPGKFIEYISLAQAERKGLAGSRAGSLRPEVK